MLMEAVIFRKTPWPVLSDVNYLLIEEAWTIAIHTQDCQWSLAISPVGAQSVCQLHGSQSLNIDLQKWEAVSPAFCVTVLYPTYSIEYTPTHSYNWRVVPVNDGWLKGFVELMIWVSASMYTLRLSIESRLRRFHLMMLVSSRSLVIRNHGSPNWKFWNLFIINSFTPSIAWGASLQHSSCFKLSLCRLHHWHPQQFIVCCLNMPLERRIYLCFFKMTIKVDFAHPQW